MTSPRPIPPPRRTDNSPVALVALVSLTVTRAVVYTDVRCLSRREMRHGSVPCGTWLMALPGVVDYSLRPMQSNEDRTGEGIAVRCRHCGSRYEVIRNG